MSLFVTNCPPWQSKILQISILAFSRGQEDFREDYVLKPVCDIFLKVQSHEMFHLPIFKIHSHHKQLFFKLLRICSFLCPTPAPYPVGWSASALFAIFEATRFYRSGMFLGAQFQKKANFIFQKKKKKKLVRLCLVTFGLTVMVQTNLLQLKNHVLPSLKKCFFKCWISPKWSLHVCVYTLLYCTYSVRVHYACEQLGVNCALLINLIRAGSFTEIP